MKFTFPIILLKIWCTECSEFTFHLLTIFLTWECLLCRADGYRSVKPSGVLQREDYFKQGVSNALPKKNP